MWKKWIVGWSSSVGAVFVMVMVTVRVDCASGSVSGVSTVISTIRWWRNSCQSWSAVGVWVIFLWLNGRASNRNRASLLSIYFVIQTGGAAAGQLLLNLSSPEGVLLFVVVSILISLSLVPILISARPSPTLEVPERISLTAQPIWIPTAGRSRDETGPCTKSVAASP